MVTGDDALVVALIVLGVIVLILMWMLAQAVNRIAWLNEDLLTAQDTEHAKCIGAVMAYIGDEFASQILRLAAEDYDSVIEKNRMQMLARDHYHTSGPSIPALWLLDRANRLDAEVAS